MDYVSERTKSKNEVSYRTIVEERSSRGLLTSENSMELSGRESYNSRYEANYGFGAEAVHFKNSLVREKEFFKDRREESDKVSAMETGKLGGNFFKHKKKEETKVAYDGPGVKLMSSSGNSLANKLNRFSCSSGQKAVQNASYDRISFPKNKNDLWCRPEKDINVREVINRREN